MAHLHAKPYSLRLCAAVLRVDSLTLALTYSGRWLGWNWVALGGSLSFYTGGQHTLRLLTRARPSMVSLSAIAAKSGRPRGRPRARWVEYRTYSCALFVRDGPTLSWQGGVAATLPPSFLFFVFSCVTAMGDLMLWGFIVGVNPAHMRSPHGIPD